MLLEVGFDEERFYGFNELIAGRLESRREELAEGLAHVVSDVLLLEQGIVLSEFNESTADNAAPFVGLRAVLRVEDQFGDLVVQARLGQRVDVLDEVGEILVEFVHEDFSRFEANLSEALDG